MGLSARASRMRCWTVTTRATATGCGCSPEPIPRSTRRLVGGTGEARGLAGRARAIGSMSARLPERLRPNSGRQEQGRCSPAHRPWVRGHRCSVAGCEKNKIECAHVRTGTDGGAGMKPSDWWTISLCSAHHADHLIGESAFESLYDISLFERAKTFSRLSAQSLFRLNMPIM